MDDELTFSFTAAGGTTGDLDYPDPADENKVTIPWTADCAVGSYTITATVNDVPYHVDDSAPATASVTVEVVDIEYVKVRRKGSGDDYDTTAKIAAGGYSSDVRKAEVAVKITPVPAGTYSVSVPVTLTDADGHVGNAVDAELVFGSDTVQHGDGTGTMTISDTNATGGEAVAILWSGNIERTCTVSAGGQSAEAEQVWDDEAGLEFYVPDYFIPGVADMCKFRCRIDDTIAITGHTIEWTTLSITIDSFEWNLDTGATSAAVNTYYWPFSAGTSNELPFGKAPGDFVQYLPVSGPSESPAGVYLEQHKVQDYASLDTVEGESVWREALVLEYGFVAYDDKVYDK